MNDQRRAAGIDRRTALRTMTAGVGAAASALWVREIAVLAETEARHAHLLAAAAQDGTWTPTVLSAEQFETVAVLAELIIPETDTPGARAALVDRYVDGVLAEASPTVRERFLEGLAWIDARSRALFGARFTGASAAQQHELLTRLAAQPSSEETAGVEFFEAIKAMTITGYYTSEIGLRQELGVPFTLMLPEFPGCTHEEHM